MEGAIPNFKTPWATSLSPRFLSTRSIGFRHFKVRWVFKGPLNYPECPHLVDSFRVRHFALKFCANALNTT